MELRSSMQDPPVGFATLMELEKINETTFRSKTAAFQPGGYYRPAGSERAYGGHVYAQAVWAASHTLDKSQVVHAVTGFFTAMGKTDLPFVYSVQSVRTGRSYGVRSVTVTQEGIQGTCFTCTASFKRPEKGNVSFSATVPDSYAEALRGLRPEDHPDYLSTDESFFLELAPEKQKDPLVKFPGMQSKKVDMTEYNAKRPIAERRQLSYYQVRDVLPCFQEAPTLHACAMLYASDRASLLSSGQLLGIKSFAAMASLSHTVIFNVTDASLSMLDEANRRKWIFQEAWTERIGDARLDHHSRIWDESGRHIATTLQDGMVRGASYDASKRSNL